MATPIFINEIHYDNGGTDAGEAIEIAGPAGTDLTGWSIVLYNGGTTGTAATTYTTTPLSGVISNLGNGYGALSFAYAVNGIQNGPFDGLALVDASGQVVQFLSYEGAITASNGPAAGMTSTDIGVSESGGGAVGNSLRLTGSGTVYEDFSWAAEAPGSFGAINAGQSFGTVSAPTLAIADASQAEGDSGATAIVFTVTRSGDVSGASSASYAVTLGSATADDFAAAPVGGTVSFAANQTSATITLQIAGDLAVEGDESFTVTLADAVNATLADAAATGTIENDDTVPPPPAGSVFINELHYDDAGTDAGEAVEIAAPVGTDLSGWSLVLYNGNGGASYGTIALSGVVPGQDDGFGTLSFDTPGLQNGAPDGVALVAPGGAVVQFLSYEGSFTATSGPAAGLTSTDIGVAEDPAPADGFSLQLVGAGSVYDDFSWALVPAENSFGGVNAGQDFISADGDGLLSVRDARVVEGDDGTQSLVVTVRRAGGSAGSVTVDYAIGFGSADAADIAPTPLTGTLSFGPGVVQQQIVIGVIGDTVGELNETLSVTLSNATGPVTIADGEATATIVNDDPIALSIMAIQGEAHASAYVGQPVITRGIVTAVDSNGFYLQDAAGDGNARTSDALFVFTGGAPTVAVGDDLRVTGEVSEFTPGAGGLSITQVALASAETLSTGNALPAATLIGAGGRTPPTETIDDDSFALFDPEVDGIDFYENLEGMRVTIDAPLVVDNSSGYGETFVVASGGAGATGINERGGITLSDGDFNPERIQIDADSAIFAGYTPDHTQGDRLDDVTGVVSYSFGNYEVLVTEAVTVTQDVTVSREATALRGDADRLSIANYNLENLDPTDDAVILDAATGATKFDILANDIVYSLGAPDIIAVQEIQDADGAGRGADLSGEATAAILIQAIKDAGGPDYVYVEVAPATPGSTGGEPGGNIRNGFFYNADRVSYVANSAELIPGGAFSGSRNPLAADFVFNGQTVTAISVHSTARSGSDPLFGSTQPPVNAGEGAREAQSEAIRAYVDGLLAADPALNIAVLGDFNGFYFEDSLEALTGDSAFVNLYDLLPEAERYSYRFDGNLQGLDNIIVSGGLAATAQFDAVHINAEQTSATIRGTDHDGLVATLFIPRPNQAPVAADDAAAVNEDATSANLWDALLANDNDPDAGNVLAIEAVDTTGTLGSLVFDATTQTLRYVADADAFDDLAPGETATDSFNYTVADGKGGTSSATVTVTVTGQADGVTRLGTLFRDTLTGTGDEDSLYGFTGNDKLFGLGANDKLFGGIGNDELDGGAGDDRLDGGLGDDRLKGGEGADSFAFGWLNGRDTILDFDTALDSILLEGGVEVRRHQLRDANRDGELDLVLSFDRGGQVTLLGVQDFAAVAFARDEGAALGGLIDLPPPFDVSRVRDLLAPDVIL